MKYQILNTTIEAFQWTGCINQMEDPEWAIIAIKRDKIGFINLGTKKVKMEVQTAHGIQIAFRGDFIIRNYSGELSVCRPDVFRCTYRKVER